MAVHLAFTLDEEYARAPEFRYLVAWVRQEVEAAFADVREIPPDTPLDVLPAGAALLAIDGRTLLARSSLRAMGARLGGEGAGAASAAAAVAPVPLAASGLAGAPVYTLRGFEAVEASALAAGAAGDLSVAAAAPAPAILFGPAGIAAAREAGARTAEDALARPAGPLARAGLCHRFTDYYGEARADVLPFLPAGCRDVLEVGCARGATGALLQQELGCRVTGVELNPVVAAAAAARLHRVIAGDFLAVAGDLALPASAAPGGAPGFDALVALELFEHLSDQEGFLAAARRVVRPGGRIVLSVPNVGHWAVVEDLLAGRWDYLPIGILCYTHYRFFTRRTLEDWLRAAGFASFALHAQETELPARFTAGLPGFELDPQSLCTKGFFVQIELPLR